MPEIANRDAVVSASKQAGSDDLIANLPAGYDTALGKWFDAGVNLMGGLNMLEVAREVELRGLMAMGPPRGDARPAFAELRGLRDETEQRLGRPLPILSMGMSDDLEAAVREGSTMLRLGRVLFGDRTL